MFCQKCGSIISADDIFCGKCGWRIIDIEDHENEGSTDNETIINSECDRSGVSKASAAPGIAATSVRTIIVSAVAGVTISSLATMGVLSTIYERKIEQIEKASMEENPNEIPEISSNSIGIGSSKSDSNDEKETVDEGDYQNEKRKTDGKDKAIIPTQDEQKYIDEAEKYLIQDDPLSAAEILTSAMMEDYYPAVNEKLKDIKKRTMDYLEVHEMHSIDSGEVSSYKTKKEYVDGRMTYYETSTLLDGEYRNPSWIKYEKDNEGNTVIIRSDSGGERKYVSETVKDEINEERKQIEHLNSIDGPITSIIYYNSEDKCVNFESYSEETGKLSSNILYEYDDKGNEIKRYYKRDGKITQTETYEYDEYGRVIKCFIETDKNTKTDTYRYTATGYSCHRESKIIEGADQTDSYLSSTSDGEYDSLGHAIYGKAITIYSDHKYDTESTYTHDYHYYSGDYGENEKNQQK